MSLEYINCFRTALGCYQVLDIAPVHTFLLTSPQDATKNHTRKVAQVVDIVDAEVFYHVATSDFRETYDMETINREAYICKQETHQQWSEMHPQP